MSPRCLLPAFAALLAAPLLAGQPQDAGADDHYRAGIGLLNKGLDEAAAAELRGCLKDRPDGPDATNARYALGVCLWKLRRPAEAARELDAVVAVKGFEFAADARLLRARCAEAAGDDRAVIDVLAALAADHPAFDKLDQATLALAEARYRLGDFKACRDALAADAWPKSPSRPRMLLFLAMAESALGETAKAAEHAAAALAAAPAGELAPNAALLEAQCRRRLGHSTAAAAYEKAAGLAKDAPGAQALRAEALLGLAQLARAAGDLAKAERTLADAGAAAPTGELADRLALERGKLLVDQNKPQDAAKVLGPIAGSPAAKPTRLAAEATLWLARAQLAQGEAAQAVRTLEEGARRFAKTELAPDLLFDLPGALAKAGDEAGALAAWDRWLARYPKHALRPDAQAARAWRLHRLGKFDDCREACAAFLAADAKHPAAEGLRLLAAENEFAAGRFGPALAAYDDLTAHQPAGPHARRAALRRGLCLKALGKPDEAAKALDAGLALPGADADLDRAALLALGEIALARSDWSEAARRFGPVADDKAAGDAGLDAALRLAICLARQGRAADALPLLDRTLAADPGAPRALHAWFEKGQALLALDRRPEAAAALKQVIAAEKALPQKTLTTPALRALAGLAARDGRPAEAAALYADLAAAGGSAQDRLDAGASLLAAGDYTRAEKTLAGLVKEDGTVGPAARVHLGIAINRQGRAAEALPLLDGAGLSAADADLRAAAAYERSLALRSLKKPAEAADACRAVLALPDAGGRLEPYAALDLAELDRAAGKHAESLTHAERAFAAATRLGGKPLLPRAAYLRAAAQLALAKPADAAATLKGFAAAYAGSDLIPAAALLRGEALLAADDAAGAAAEFDLASDAKNPADVRAPALLRLGEAHAQARRWKESDAAYSAFLEAFPASDQWFRARFGQGWARENLGRHEDAIAAYRLVASRHKGATAARAQFQVGECCYAMKKLDQAVAEYAKTDVLFAVPEWSAAALYEAGRCLDELNKPDDAKRQFDDLIKRFPDTSWAKLAKERKPPATAALPGR